MSLNGPSALAIVAFRQDFGDGQVAAPKNWAKLRKEDQKRAIIEDAMSVNAGNSSWYEAEEDEEEAQVHYDIASYPSDLTLSVVHEMWKDGAIEIPEYQRNYVWHIRQASLLVESFLLGLPVPQVFFYVDENSRNQVIDGQQRIMSVVYFLEGYFGEERADSRKQVFRLQGLSARSPFHLKRFVDLDDNFQRKFKGAVLRAVNIRQLSPRGEATSVYHIFERLNTGGTPLQPQEIRNCVYRGELTKILQALNENSDWRKILGREALDKHQKDVELLLRVFAFSSFENDYEKPLKEFLNKSMARERKGDSEKVRRFADVFPRACAEIVRHLGAKPCHLRGPLNASALDALFAIVIGSDAVLPADFRDRFQRLKANSSFQASTHVSTSDKQVVAERMEVARSLLVD